MNATQLVVAPGVDPSARYLDSAPSTLTSICDEASAFGSSQKSSIVHFGSSVSTVLFLAAEQDRRDGSAREELEVF